MRQTPLLAAALGAATALTSPAFAQTVLRLDEVAVGELDPAKASDYADSILMFNVYDTLVLPTQGAPGHDPHLATSWEVDGSSYTFTLRDDVTFQSGNPFTAADVVYSLERMQALGQGLSYLFGGVTAEAVDDTTVRFDLGEPYAPFIASLVRLPIVDSALIEANATADDEWGESFLSAHGAGSGAYTVTSHNPQEETVMAVNSDYFLPIDEAAPDEVRLRYGLEGATVRTLLAQGEHDIASQWLPPEVIRALAEDGAQLLTESGTGAFYIKLNTARAPLDDVDCRLALASAFDYATALQMVAITDDVAAGSASTGAIPVGMFGANPAEDVLTRDLDAARAYLADCPTPPADWNLEISWIAEVPLEERFALLMQANFAELGISSSIETLPWALFTERVASPENTPHISQIFANAVTGDPDTLLYSMYHSSVPGTWQSPEYLDDPEVDAALEAGRRGPSEAERDTAYSALNARLMDLAPTIYAYDRQSVFAASNRVSVPALSDPAKAFGMDGMGFTFRLMEMTEE
ncbi:ABC transporter substrate-binding protein [Wenxinia saemankumensis]|uniref:Peptide/nickel transport system substrate-binding protein n=1 Tax=Wenxinia saemankumensis TaxID=1447782 RepID=A0A1M6I1G5_9RHOB|nr:ABC transporter substrate-binding protein [Wenxinia saemankumensis]SHJ28285.1 peptide/nickel transport system substrate-binding protein [Wenxinia saemankumensis]